MSSSKASNAILAKARAMYGKCLTDDDYHHLLECKSVPEVATYLKTRTNYASVLSGMNENDVHRGQLEPILKQNIYFDVFSLSRYANDKSQAFTDYIISRMEVEQIIRCLTLLNIGKPDEYVYSMPLSLDQFARISLKALTKVRTYEDIYEALKGTWYIPILKKYEPEEGHRIHIARLEAELNSKLSLDVIDSLSKASDKKAQAELEDLFATIRDINNIARILRLKKYYNFEADQIKPLLGPYGKLKPKTIDTLCSAENSKEIFELSRSTYLGRVLSKLQYNSQTQITDALISNYCKHHLRLSPNPNIVMISYVYLKEIEISNIVNIIEGTRYGISAEEKSKNIIR